MTDHKTADTPAELWVTVLGLLDRLAERVERQDAILLKQQAALERRPTKRQTLTFGTRLLLLVVSMQLVLALVTIGILRSGQRQISECVGEDPTTECRRRSAETTAKAVKVIVDANGNGVVDVDEILRAIQGSPP